MRYILNIFKSVNYLALNFFGYGWVMVP